LLKVNFISTSVLLFGFSSLAKLAVIVRLANAVAIDVRLANVVDIDDLIYYVCLSLNVVQLNTLASDKDILAFVEAKSGVVTYYR
jgi:hypothetical protein